jgi:hypothetical protein
VTQIREQRVADLVVPCWSTIVSYTETWRAWDEEKDLLVALCSASPWRMSIRVGGIAVLVGSIEWLIRKKCDEWTTITEKEERNEQVKVQSATNLIRDLSKGITGKNQD